MAIQIFDNQAQSDAVAQPKSVWSNLGQFVVRTGEDLPVAQPITTIPVQEFRSRFTDAEIIAFELSTDSGVVLLRGKLQTNDFGIDLTTPTVIGGVQYLASKGIIDVSRVADILRVL